MTIQSTFWCDRKLLVTVEGPEGRSSTTIEKPFARVGSHDASEVVLPDRRIGRRRLYFHATDSGIFCVNLAPSYFSEGTLRGWVRPEQELLLGPYRISARLADEDSPPAVSGADWDAPGSAEGPAPVVQATVNGREIGRLVLTRRLTLLGRRRSCMMRLTSRSVSASHCINSPSPDSLSRNTRLAIREPSGEYEEKLSSPGRSQICFPVLGSDIFVAS